MNQQAPSPPAPPDPAQASIAATSPFPSHRDLYVLVAGILLGVLLSAAVLGRVAPQVYDRMFVGSGEAYPQLLELEERKQQMREDLTTSDASPVALVEELAQIDGRQQTLREQIAVSRFNATSQHAARMVAILLAVIAVMVIEPLVAPQPTAFGQAVVSPASGRLITIRYALIALWIALAIAQPTVLTQVPLLFTLLLIAVALIAAFVPLGPRATATAERR